MVFSLKSASFENENCFTKQEERNDVMTLGNRIRTRREELKLTQNELAKRTHLRQNYISRLENDKFEPTATVIILLAKTLKLPIEELLGVNETNYSFQN